jgi:hypothetical protein
MTYDLFTIGDLDRARLAAALAALVSVGVDAVDVSAEDAGEADDRDWDATVSCVYTAVAGDLDWQLDIYLNGVADEPSEAEAAAYLAEQLDQVVLYPAPVVLPSAFWLAAPGGRVTRARLYQDDERFQLDAVERAVPELPSVRVEAQPEVIREYRQPVPITAALGESAGPRLTDLLMVWEMLTARMTGGWPPDGWYPAEYYAQDLRARDELAESVDQLADAIAAPVLAALERLDERFRAGTVDDVDSTLAGLTGISRIDLRLREWWWRRIPNPVPWPASAG